MAGRDSTALSYTWPKPPPRALRPIDASQGYWVSHFAAWDHGIRPLGPAWARVRDKLSAYCTRYATVRKAIKDEYGMVPARK